MKVLNDLFMSINSNHWRSTNKLQKHLVSIKAGFVLHRQLTSRLDMSSHDYCAHTI